MFSNAAINIINIEGGKIASAHTHNKIFADPVTCTSMQSSVLSDCMVGTTLMCTCYIRMYMYVHKHAIYICKNKLRTLNTHIYIRIYDIVL